MGHQLARADAQEICRASERAAALTRQLLAFSRRQVLRPEVLDLGEVVAGMEKMLRRLLGENVHLITRRAAGVGKVKADPGQLEQVVGPRGVAPVRRARRRDRPGADRRRAAGTHTASRSTSGSPAIAPRRWCCTLSGYTEGVLDHHGVLEQGIPFIHKPFTPDALLVKIRDVLDRRDVMAA